jgi:hypothetical protein
MAALYHSTYGFKHVSSRRQVATYGTVVIDSISVGSASADYDVGEDARALRPSEIAKDAEGNGPVATNLYNIINQHY